MCLVINIKNMVCPRCISAVQQIFDQLDLEVNSIALGSVELKSNKLSKEQYSKLDARLVEQGFERIDDQRSKLLEEIKTLVIDTIHHQDHFNLSVNWSSFIVERLNYDYPYLSTLFSTTSGITLEQYIIKQKIEKVKEYLIYDQLSIKEISFKLGYSSVAHLSAQFKKVTGMTPSAFRVNHSGSARTALDHIQ